MTKQERQVLESFIRKEVKKYLNEVDHLGRKKLFSVPKDPDEKSSGTITVNAFTENTFELDIVSGPNKNTSLLITKKQLLQITNKLTQN